MDELVPGEIEGGKVREPSKQLGGDVIEGVMGEAQEGQVGQDAIILASPSENDGGT